MISEENREIQKLLSLIGLARKAGKLPRETVEAKYTLEYGT